jgi:peptidoglycan/LPS O-acetylase OafA/YrhL
MRNLYIDRLRGMAALMVVLSHASGYIPFMLLDLPQRLRVSIAENGYHGVSIFFTISGFLITNKLLSSADEDGRFSLQKFYRDRVGRIAPGLILMVCAALLAAIFVGGLFSIDWNTLPQRMFYIFTFQYNVHVQALGGSRIWDPLWSLSVEEMFYLCFPLTLLLVRNRKIVVAILAAVVIIGPISRVWTEKPYPYFSNFDEIAFGALVAIGLSMANDWNPTPTVLRGFRYAGLSVIAATFYWTQNTYGNMTWGPTFMGLGTAAYLVGASRCDARPRVALVPLEQYGELSYEIYLSHMLLLTALYPVFHLVDTSTVLVQATMSYVWPAVLLVGLLFGSQFIARFYSEPANRFIRGDAWRRQSLNNARA